MTYKKTMLLGQVYTGKIEPDWHIKMQDKASETDQKVKHQKAIIL
jgi:hypothetical protein